MNLIDYAQLGIGIFSVAAIVVIVIKFLMYLSKKDEESVKKDQAFLNVITNHLHSEQKAFTELTNEIKTSNAVNKELLSFLRNNKK